MLMFLTSVPHIDAHSIEIGDSRDSVIADIGEPGGFMASGDMETLFYKRGTVMLERGKVISVQIRSAEKQKQIEAEKLQALDDEREAKDRARKAHIEKGRAEKRRLLESEEFKSLPPHERLAQWRSFQHTYPDVSIEEILKTEGREARGADTEEVTARIGKLEQQILEVQKKRRLTPNNRLRRRYSRERREMEEELSSLRLRQEEIQKSTTP